MKTITAEQLALREARDEVEAAIEKLAYLLQEKHDRLQRERDEAGARLPKEMQDCTIMFKECAAGHGTLTADNWVQRECQICRAETVERERDEATRYLRNFLVSYVNKYCDPVPTWKPLENDLIGMLTQLDNASTVTGEFKRERDEAIARADLWQHEADQLRQDLTEARELATEYRRERDEARELLRKSGDGAKADYVAAAVDKQHLREELQEVRRQLDEAHAVLRREARNALELDGAPRRTA